MSLNGLFFDVGINSSQEFMKGLIYFIKRALKNIGIYLTGLALILPAATSNVAFAQIKFEDVSSKAGIKSSGQNDEAFSISWLDYNSDGYPDLYISPHFYYNWQRPKIYLNKGNKTFEDVFDKKMPLRGDTHGVTWTDFDNDSDPDLFVSVGAVGGLGVGSKLFYNNNKGVLQEEAVARGLDNPMGRGRSSLWFDGDNDGLLDVLMLSAIRPGGVVTSSFFKQTAEGKFVDYNAAVGLSIPESSRFAQLTDVTGDGRLDLVIHGAYAYPLKVYDLQDSMFLDITSTLPRIDDPNKHEGGHSRITPRDAVIADFNNDQRSDFFLVRGNVENTGGAHVKSWNNIVSANLALNPPKAPEVGVSFKTTKSIDVYFIIRWEADSPFPFNTSNIYVGANGFNPVQSSGFTLSPNDAAVAGIKPHTPGVDQGVFIGFDPAMQTWKILYSSLKPPLFLRLLVKGVEPLENVAPINFKPVDVYNLALSDILWMYDNLSSSYIDKTQGSGLEKPTLCNSAVAGDFDNDMDVDIFLSCDYFGFHVPNILYENQGDGTFNVAPSAGGAEGRSVGPHLPAWALGSRIAIADYDNDGFLDIFSGSTNALSYTGAVYPGNPPQLFHNVGNKNRWLEIDLKGVTSNADGVGAQIFATAGGVTQLREQGGGMHHFAQNHNRIHFGMADHKSIEELRIRWPSGIIQTLENLPTNQIIEVFEPVKPTVLGKPAYTAGMDTGVYLWKASSSDMHRLHISSPLNGPENEFIIKLVSSLPLATVTETQLDGRQDTLTRSDYGFSLKAKVGAGDPEDAIGFKINPQASTLISVEQNGQPNPRQLHIGRQSLPLPPAGWIIAADALQARPTLVAGKESGFAIGQSPSPGLVEARWSGDGLPGHLTKVILISSYPFTSLTPKDLEPEEIRFMKQTTNSVNIIGSISTGWDGIDAGMNLSAGAELGIVYQQDGLFQSHFIKNKAAFGLPNAYWLPLR